MPKPGPAYPISSKWKGLVKDRINELRRDPDSGVTSEATFAKKAGISKSALSQTLGAESKQSSVLFQINAALGWPAPRVLSTPDEIEIWNAVEMLDEREIGRLIEKAEQTLTRLKSKRG